MHLAPRRNWINDPNGLVFHDGRYHAFFQYNPDGIHHDNISWGHMTSPDLVQWEEHDVALRATPDVQIYSGSAVVDLANSSGLGEEGTPALVAFYTAHSRLLPHQAQAIAYSTDDGQTWADYAGNPVVDRDSSDFRDPKVFWFEGDAGSYWVMVAVEARERQVVFYRSDDLLSWDYLSSFGPERAVGGVWECPDLFPLAIDGDPDRVRWVLIISLSAGGVAGGSGTMYVLGTFDGLHFTPEQPWTGPDVGMDAAQDDLERIGWLDYGRDNYAGVSFSGLPDDQRTVLAWMSNWDYAHHLPYDHDAPQLGRMTLPRRLSLVTRGGRVELCQEAIGPQMAPVALVEQRRLEAHEQVSFEVPEESRIELSISLDDATGFSLLLGSDPETALSLRYNAATNRVWLDRRHAPDEFPEAFHTVQSMPVEGGREVTWTLWIGRASIELFTDGGTRSFTNLSGLHAGPTMWLEPTDGAAQITELTIHAT